ncbi:MAG: ABC transporter ATP-binding protein [Granulosicoccus sp.]|nr:ABC transporter ATP-binding protein [Granulosicoccus sp.]
MSLISCQGLSKRFGSTLAVDQLTIDIPAGEPIALIGPNGAGKTTLLSLICGFIKPSAGTVTVLGCAPGADELGGRLSALPQDAQFDPRLNIGRQLQLFARLQGMNRSQAGQEVQRVLDTVGLLDSIKQKPDQLSHGMRKRIALAQALIGRPELVLLDEPTAGIDPPNAKLIRDLIRQESNHTTFIVSSHNLDELERLCASVIYLEKGRLVSFGSVADDAHNDVLTLRLPNVAETEVIEASLHLPLVSNVTRTVQGDYLIETTDDMQTSAALMQMLKERGWQYRHLVRGKTLEERLYGQ